MDRPPDSHSPDRVERHLDRGLALGFGKQPGPEPPSVLQRLAAVTGGSQMVSLRDPDHAAPEPLLKPLAPESGARAGKYVIQGELGSGGVGAVHRGHDQDLGRDVALKFLHDRYRDQPQFVQRFVEEAQIGGQLQHPGIVPVYDFGLADDRPFFAMKLVKGQTLAAALADRDSPADERTRFLGVFEQVCQTIAYAHARGVVHRDLKPANVMIGSFGEVQVVDWGMGKVLRSGGVADERRATDGQSDQPPVATVRTGRPGSHSVAGSVFGTPAYMAPEQARGDIEQMDERSDVFALGAILCEILTGHPPYSGTDEQVLAKAAAADCREAAGRLATCGAGHELIALTTRCLAATNRQRPRNAAVVAAAVRDHLITVEQRAHDAQVRAAALQRTQRLAGMSLVLITIGLAVSLWFWREAATAAVAAGLENEVRSEVLRFLNDDLLAAVAPGEAGRDASMRRVLDIAAERIDGRFRDRPLVEAPIRSTVGHTYSKLGMFDAAERHLRRAVDLYRAELGPDGHETLLAELRLATLLKKRGRTDDAVAIGDRALTALSTTRGWDDPDTLMAANNHGLLLAELNRYEEAERLLREVVDVRLRLLGETHPDTQVSMSNLGLVYYNQGKLDEAMPWMERELALCRRTHGDEDPGTLTSMNNWANLLVQLGREEEALMIHREAAAAARRVFGERNLQTVNHLMSVAATLSRLGRSEAEAAWREALAAGADLGDGHPLMLHAQLLLIRDLKLRGRLDEAERALDRFDAAAATAGDAVATDADNALVTRAQILLLRGQAETAVERLAARLAERTEASDSRATLQQQYATCLLEMARFEAAESALLEAHAFYETNASTTPRVGELLQDLARLYERWGRDEQAQAMRRRLTDWRTARARR